MAFDMIVTKRISNNEGRNSIVFCRFKRLRVAIPSFEILLFVILLFCGSLFGRGGLHTSCQLSFVVEPFSE